MKALRAVGRVISVGGRFLLAGVLVIGNAIAGLIGLIVTAICSSK